MQMRSYLGVLLVVAAFVIAANGQTNSFSYQGRLTDGAVAANGTYQMQFSLYDAPTVGTQVGTTITNASVAVVNGVFTVQLDFSPATPFSTGADRWLEIAVRKVADPPGYTTLTPRQQITSSPYSIRTLSAASADGLSNLCVQCVTDSQISGVSGSKVTGSVANATAAGTATQLQTGRTINGTPFDGTSNITVTSAADTLTGTTLNGTVTGSSLTSVGTLSALTVNGTTNINNSNNAATTIGTGTTTGAVTIGGGSNTVAINSPQVSQPTGSVGLVKAAACVEVSGGVATVSRQFNKLPGNAVITVGRVGPGQYNMAFGTNLSSRFFQGNVADCGFGGGASFDGSVSIFVPFLSNGAEVLTMVGSIPTDRSFFIVVY